jgi:hypothetical protein
MVVVDRDERKMATGSATAEAPIKDTALKRTLAADLADCCTK